MSEIPADAPRSEDGYYWWDGSQWLPVDGGGFAETASTEEADTADYMSAATPGQPWRTPPTIPDAGEAVEQAWESAKETAEEVWDWATGSESEQTPADGGGGGEGAPPYYDTGGGGQGGYGDGGLPPGGLPDQPCGLGSCPTCGEELSMSSPCIYLEGHEGDHECAQDHAWEQADASSVPMARKCDAKCLYVDENGRECEKRCIRKFMHHPPEHLCNLGHTW